jgi:choline dehydrogenase
VTDGCTQVILGGGTAGLAIAHRLAEDGTRTVAVIEAGGSPEFDNGNTSIIPAYCPEYGATTEASANQFPLIDWGFVTQPQKGLGGRKLHYGRGKTLGGRYVSASRALGLGDTCITHESIVAARLRTP